MKKLKLERYWLDQLTKNVMATFNVPGYVQVYKTTSYTCELDGMNTNISFST